MRVTGFVLIAAGILGALLVFSNAERYAPQMGFMWNMANAKLFQQEVVCPDPGLTPRSLIPEGCPQTSLSYDSQKGFDRKVTFEFGGITLGVALTASVAVALLGLGLIIFGENRSA